MGHSKCDRLTKFKLEGRFLGFLLEDGYKIKFLQLATASGEYTIKLSKESRASLGYTLTPGDWIQVQGSQKVDLETGYTKFKAFQIDRISPGEMQPLAIAPVETPAEAPKVEPKKQVILVCQKSDCCKRGGRQVTAALEQALSDRDLADQVVIKGTGCMKRCKAGPNLVMPDKTRYSQIHPQMVPALVEHHFQPAPIEQAS